MAFTLDEQRLAAFSAHINIAEIKEYLCGFQRICQGGVGGGEIGKLPMPERFRWLTATRSTVVQTSKVHPGFCESAAEMLEMLYRQLVL